MGIQPEIIVKGIDHQEGGAEYTDDAKCTIVHDSIICWF
jgi:hypothetical protein